MRKRYRDESDEDEGRRGAPEPPPFLGMLDETEALGIHEGQMEIGPGPRPLPRTPAPRDRPPYEKIDRDRYYVDDVGYIRDRGTGELLPGEEKLMPGHPDAQRLEQEAIREWYE